MPSSFWCFFRIADALGLHRMYVTSFLARLIIAFTPLWTKIEWFTTRFSVWRKHPASVQPLIAMAFTMFCALSRTITWIIPFNPQDVTMDANDVAIVSPVCESSNGRHCRTHDFLFHSEFTKCNVKLKNEFWLLEDHMSGLPVLRVHKCRV